MEKVASAHRFRLVLSVAFVLLAIVGAAGWAITGQREVFEVPTLFFSATLMVLVFSFF
jgi:hypothetical protein